MASDEKSKEELEKEEKERIAKELLGDNPKLAYEKWWRRARAESAIAAAKLEKMERESYPRIANMRFIG